MFLIVTMRLKLLIFKGEIFKKFFSHKLNMKHESSIGYNVPQVYLVRDLEAQTFKLVKT